MIEGRPLVSGLAKLVWSSVPFTEGVRVGWRECGSALLVPSRWS